jgi:hypothetical protein
MWFPKADLPSHHNMNMILDGHTGIEHNVPIYPLYNDVLKIWEASDVGYTLQRWL